MKYKWLNNVKYFHVICALLYDQLKKATQKDKNIIQSFKTNMMGLILAFSCAGTLHANDSLPVQRLVAKIYQQQIQQDAYFPKGIFPSYRMYYYNRGILKKDANSFFTGLIVFTLRTLRPYLDNASQQICDSIFVQTLPVFKRFQNPRGKPLYSFWQTKPVRYFPNSGLLSLCKANALPDDADCTAICLLALQADRAAVQQMHAHAQHFTNNKKHKVRSTFSMYKNIPAYSTWLSNKVPVDFDVCVLTNILYLVHQYHLPYTKADSASLQLVQQVIEHRQYRTHAMYVSPYYNKPSVFLYHVSRLMSIARIPQLEPYRQQLINEAMTLYQHCDNQYEKIILSTTLLRWGVVPPVGKEVENSNEPFVFFVANMASMLPNPINQWLTQSSIARFDYYCPAYNDVLQVENMIWQQRVKSERVTKN